MVEGIEPRINVIKKHRLTTWLYPYGCYLLFILYNLYNKNYFLKNVENFLESNFLL